MGRRGGTKIDSSILRQVEHADLINYGLIPEFVGRLPVIVSLQVGARTCLVCVRFVVLGSGSGACGQSHAVSCWPPGMRQDVSILLSCLFFCLEWGLAVA